MQCRVVAADVTSRSLASNHNAEPQEAGETDSFIWGLLSQLQHPHTPFSAAVQQVWDTWIPALQLHCMGGGGLSCQGQIQHLHCSSWLGCCSLAMDWQ